MAFTQSRLREALPQRAPEADQRGIGPLGGISVSHLEARDEGIEVRVSKRVVQRAQTLPHLIQDELAYKVITAHHGIEDCLRRLLWHAPGYETNEFVGGGRGVLRRDAAARKLVLVRNEGVQALHADARAVGNHRHRGILEEVAFPDQRDDFLVIIALQTKVRNHTHLVREELLSGERTASDCS